MRTVRQCILLFSGDAEVFAICSAVSPIRNPVEYSALPEAPALSHANVSEKKVSGAAQRAGFVDINQHARQFFTDAIGNTEEESAPPAIPARIVPPSGFRQRSQPPENWWRKRGCAVSISMHIHSSAKNNFTGNVGASGICTT